MKYPSAHSLASAYSQEVDAHLTPADLAEVIAGNSVVNDYCDGNQLLIDAWQATTGEECVFSTADARMIDLMNEAQELAQASGYAVAEVDVNSGRGEA